MTTTPNFEVTHLEDNQDNKETAINAGWDRFDRRLSSVLTHNMSSDADYVLDTTDPALEHLYYLIRITDTGGVLSGKRVIQFPANKGPYVFHNLTAFDLDARVGGAGGLVTLGTGTLNGIYNDGTDMLLSAGAGGTPSATFSMDFPIFLGGRPQGPAGTNEALRLPFTKNYRFPQDLVGSRGTALYGADAGGSGATFTFLKNSVAFATATFAAGASTPTFVCAANTDFSAGDVFSCDVPNPADPALRNVGFHLAITRL